MMDFLMMVAAVFGGTWLAGWTLYFVAVAASAVGVDS